MAISGRDWEIKYGIRTEPEPSYTWACVSLTFPTNSGPWVSCLASLNLCYLIYLQQKHLKYTAKIKWDKAGRVFGSWQGSDKCCLAFWIPSDNKALDSFGRLPGKAIRPWDFSSLFLSSSPSIMGSSGLKPLWRLRNGKGPGQESQFSSLAMSRWTWYRDACLQF